jgi:hypothetical protein
MKIKYAPKLILCFFFSLISLAPAEETPEETVKRLVELGNGPPEPKKDDTGSLISLYIVGQAEIPKALGPAKGMMLAQKRASLQAKAEFVKWMESNVTSIETQDDQSIIVKTGDGDNLSEQGKSEEIDSKKISEVAQGLVKGLKLIAKDQDPNTGLLTLVYSWSPAGAQLANDAKQANNRPAESPATTTQGKGKNPSGDIPKKTIISPDFDE